MRILELVIVILCLPFYAMAWPFVRWERGRAVQKVRQLSCPSCGALLEAVTIGDLISCHVRLRPGAGATIEWDRLSRWRITCPACFETCCIDRRFRFTACDPSDAVERAQSLS